MSTNQIGALTTLIIFGVVYIGTPLWAERRGRNWKIWLFLAFVFPGISLIALFLLPNRKGKHSVTDTSNRETEKPDKMKTGTSAATYDSLEQPLPDLNTANTEGKDKVASGPATKKSYTEEFKKEVVHTALTAGTSLSEIARMYEINLTLVRNWKAKYEAEILQEINGDDGNENGKEDDIPTPTAIWHIDRAKFVFSDPAEYKQWKKEKKVFFEFSPSGADDGGEAVFADADAATDDFEVTEDRGLVKITLEKDGPVISAWVGVLAETVEDLDQETLTDWSNDQGGWSCSSIYLGDFEASIVEDDGGDWRLVEADKHWDAEEVEGKYMEVIVTQSDDSEHIYWVNLESLPEDEDEYDWSIQAAVEHHNTLGLEQVSEDEASASEPFSRDESEFTFVNTDMVSSGGNTNSNENGTGVSESRVASVCQITFGILEDGEDRPAGFCGIDDFSKSTTVIGFQDEEGEWVGFAIDDGNGKFFIDNCDIGSLDGKSLRGALPYNAGDLWNTIMLSSVDLEEIEEEGIKFKLFDRDDNADDDLRPFHIKSALKGSARTPCHLVVHKTFGQFEFADFSKELFDVNAFFNGSLETPVSLSLESLGEISDFETDSETLCIVPLSKDRQPIEL